MGQPDSDRQTLQVWWDWRGTGLEVGAVLQIQHQRMLVAGENSENELEQGLWRTVARSGTSCRGTTRAEDETWVERPAS